MDLKKKRNLRKDEKQENRLRSACRFSVFFDQPALIIYLELKKKEVILLSILRDLKFVFFLNIMWL